MKLFGTDGIRGRANRSPMTPEQVLRIGMAVALVVKTNHGSHRPNRNAAKVVHDLIGYFAKIRQPFRVHEDTPTARPS